MMDPRYTLWLMIADELETLHNFAYGESGPLMRNRSDPFKPTGPTAALWIRKKCTTGRWYWWDKGWLAGKANEPLQSFQHVIGDCNGLHEETAAGRELVTRISRIQESIKAAAS